MVLSGNTLQLLTSVAQVSRWVGAIRGAIAFWKSWSLCCLATCLYRPYRPTDVEQLREQLRHQDSALRAVKRTSLRPTMCVQEPLYVIASYGQVHSTKDS